MGTARDRARADRLGPADGRRVAPPVPDRPQSSTDDATDRPEQARPRDRDATGRPEQARPRDRTGRPLAFGTSGVETIEDHQPATTAEALELGRRLWSEERYFEAHECLEVVWKAAPPDEADLWQGVIQIAVAGVHLQRGNPSGAVTLLERAERRLSGYPDGHLGFAVSAAVATCRRARERIAADPSTPAAVVGGFPAAGEVTLPEDRGEDGA